MDFAYQAKHPPAKLVSMATASHAAQESEYWLTAVNSTDRLTPNLGNLSILNLMVIQIKFLLAMAK